jgi:hypothetical protein
MCRHLRPHASALIRTRLLRDPTVCVCCLAGVLQDTLRIWAELGAKDPEQLKQLLVKRSLAPLTALAVQSVLDFVACGGEASSQRLQLEASCSDWLVLAWLGPR